MSNRTNAHERPSDLARWQAEDAAKAIGRRLGDDVPKPKPDFLFDKLAKVVKGGKKEVEGK